MTVPDLPILPVRRYHHPMVSDDAHPALPPVLTASQRLAAALGRPQPRPMSDAERADWEARQDAADAEAARIYSDGHRNAA